MDCYLSHCRSFLEVSEIRVCVCAIPVEFQLNLSLLKANLVISDTVVHTAIQCSVENSLLSETNLK